MKEITEDILKLNGFDTNHPDRVLKKFYLSKTLDGCEFHVTAKQECLPTADGKTVANIVKKFID